MTLGMFVAALGVYFFLIPSKLIVGSITGLSIVISKLLPFISVGNVIFIINAVLLVLSFRFIGNEFGAKTVYTALILGPMVDFIGTIFPMSESMFTQHLASHGIVTNPWFDLLCFVLVLSASQSILFSINASTGGLDILAKIINKYTGINLGTSVTVAGGAICCTAFAINTPDLVIIGLIGTWMNGLILNHFMMGMNKKNRVLLFQKTTRAFKIMSSIHFTWYYDARSYWWFQPSEECTVRDYTKQRRVIKPYGIPWKRENRLILHYRYCERSAWIME